MQPSTIFRAILAGVASIAFSTMAFAQLTTAPKATGPSGAGFLANVAGWLENHQGAAIALGTCLVLTLGLIAWNKFGPGAGDAKK